MLVTLGTVRLVASRASVPAGVLENVAVTGVPEPLVTVAVATVDWTFPTWVRAVIAEVPQVILYGAVQAGDAANAGAGTDSSTTGTAQAPVATTARRLGRWSWAPRGRGRWGERMGAGTGGGSLSWGVWFRSLGVRGCRPWWLMNESSVRRNGRVADRMMRIRIPCIGFLHEVGAGSATMTPP